MQRLSDATKNANQLNGFGNTSRQVDHGLANCPIVAQSNVGDITSVLDDGHMDSPGNGTEPHEILKHQQPATTTTTSSGAPDGETIKAVSFCSRFVEELSKLIDKHSTYLSNATISKNYADDLLRATHLSPSERAEIPFTEPFDFIKTILGFASSDEHADSGGSRPSSLAGHTEEPSEEMEMPIETAIHSDGPLIYPVQDQDLSLSALLSKVRAPVDTQHMVTLSIIEEPKPLWHVRTIHCLANQHCTALSGQSGIQRHYIRIKWINEHGYDLNNSLVVVRILTHDNQLHSRKVAVPPNTTVKGAKSSTGKIVKKKKTTQRMREERKTLNDLIIDQNYGFDPDLRMLLYPLKEENRDSQQMNLPVHVFNTYTTDQGATEEEGDQDTSHEDQLLKLFKLRIQLFTRTPANALAVVSNAVDTVLIEESKSTGALKVERLEWISTGRDGKAELAVVLNTNSEKAGFVVCVNGRKLQQHEYRGVTNNTLHVKPPEKTKDNERGFRLTMSKLSAMETIRRGRDPRLGLFEKEIFDGSILYGKEFTGDDRRVTNQD